MEAFTRYTVWHIWIPNFMDDQNTCSPRSSRTPWGHLVHVPDYTLNFNLNCLCLMHDAQHLNPRPCDFAGSWTGICDLRHACSPPRIMISFSLPRSGVTVERRHAVPTPPMLCVHGQQSWGPDAEKSLPYMLWESIHLHMDSCMVRLWERSATNNVYVGMSEPCQEPQWHLDVDMAQAIGPNKEIVYPELLPSWSTAHRAAQSDGSWTSLYTTAVAVQHAPLK